MSETLNSSDSTHTSFQKSANLVRSASSLEGPARWYTESEQTVTHEGEILNKQFPYNEKAIQVLRSLSQIRIIKNYESALDDENATGFHYLPTRYEGLQMLQHVTPDEKNEQTIASDFSGEIIEGQGKNVHSKGGRVIYLSGQQWKEILGFTIPDQVSSPDASEPVISIKGLGGPFRTITLDMITRNDRGNRLHGLLREKELTAEQEVTELLGRTTHEVYDMFGNLQKEVQFHPGRHILYSRPLDTLRVITPEGKEQIIDLTNPKEREKYPRLNGENRPYVAVYINWTGYDFSEIQTLEENAQQLAVHAGVALRDTESGERPYDGPFVREQLDLNDEIYSLRVLSARKELSRITKEIYQQLLYHPNFHEQLSTIHPENLSESEFIRQFIGNFITSQINKNYMDAQIAAAEHVTLGNRGEHNTQFGGEKDLGDGTFLFEETKAGKEHPFTEKDYEKIQNNNFLSFQQSLFKLVERLSSLLMPDEKKVIIKHIETTFAPSAEKAKLKQHVRDINQATRTAFTYTTRSRNEDQPLPERHPYSPSIG